VLDISAHRPLRTPHPHHTNLPHKLPQRPLPDHGKPDMRAFPQQKWAQYIARTARTTPAAMMESQHPFGDPDLRQAIANHVYAWRGIQATPAQIMITAGALDGVELCLRALAHASATVAVENPCFPLLRDFLRTGHWQMHPLHRDAHGTCPPEDGMHPHVLILTPSHHYPLGGCLPMARRHALLHWALRQQAWILEDDYDSEFRYSGAPIPALKSITMAEDRVFYIGSMTKLFSSSLRLGFVVLPESCIPHFMAYLRENHSKASVLPQRPLANFMADGHFDRHLRKMRRLYGQRRSLLWAHIQKELSPYGTATDHQAGMHIVLHLHPPQDDQKIAKIAAAQGIALAALSSYYIPDATTAAHNGILLGFCNKNEDELRSYVQQIKSILHTAANHH
jgi:GntR family transcriptional regulator/MocR family aminotransferase